MKILVLQLARFGDIYQSWPAVRALRRTYPEAHITLMVREKFKAATVGLHEVNEIVALDPARILAPIFFQMNGLDDSLVKLQEFLVQQQQHAYDRIVNLSFSPVSSYLVDALATENTVVTGYSRYSDGYLAIPDDASAYFYAQVGNDRWNRIHLSDLFVLIAGVESISRDWRAPDWSTGPVTSDEYIVIQPGASQINKTLSSGQWKNLVQTLLHETSYSVVILGSREERAHFEWPHSSRIIDLMGKTPLIESMKVISDARALIGPDSVCLHMASLTATPTFNLSVGPVRFWETGPRAPLSRVLRLKDSEDFSLSEFLREFLSFLNGTPSETVYELRDGEGVAYQGPEADMDVEFQWRLTQALYMHSDYPAAPDRKAISAFQRVGELADLGLEQIETVKSPNARQIGLSILGEIDHLLEKVCELDSRVTPLVNWFATQKLRIGPGDLETVLAATKQCFVDLHTITHVYALPVNWNENLVRKDLTWKP